MKDESIFNRDGTLSTKARDVNNKHIKAVKAKYGDDGLYYLDYMTDPASAYFSMIEEERSIALLDAYNLVLRKNCKVMSNALEFFFKVRVDLQLAAKLYNASLKALDAAADELGNESPTFGPQGTASNIQAFIMKNVKTLEAMESAKQIAIKEAQSSVGQLELGYDEL